MKPTLVNCMLVLLATGFIYYAYSDLVECSGTQTLTNLSGAVTSPGYPSSYGAGMNCAFRLIAPEGKLIMVTFDTFDLDPANCQDNVKVYSGDRDQLIGTYCGGTSPGQIISSTNQLYVTFTSDKHTERQGFKFHWSFINEGAGPTDLSPRLLVGIVVAWTIVVLMIPICAALIPKHNCRRKTRSNESQQSSANNDNTEHPLNNVTRNDGITLTRVMGHEITSDTQPSDNRHAAAFGPSRSSQDQSGDLLPSYDEVVCLVGQSNFPQVTSHDEPPPYKDS